MTSGDDPMMPVPIEEEAKQMNTTTCLGRCTGGTHSDVARYTLRSMSDGYNCNRRALILGK